MIHMIESFLDWGGTKKDITCLVLSAVALAVSILAPGLLPFDAA